VRRLILALPLAALLAGPAVLAFFSGGYFDGPRLAAGVGAWLLLIVAALTAPAVVPRRAAGRVALAGLAGLTAWTGLSIAWAPLAGPATDDFQRLLLYLAAFAAAAALLRSRSAWRAVEPALAAGTVIVIGYGLSGRLLPGVIEQTRSSSALGRLEQPLTYWNATGALAAMGFVLCARLAGDASRGRTTRALAAAGSVPLAVGAYLSFSRGALAAAAVGCAVLLILVRNRSQVRAVAVTLGAGAAASVVANALPAVRAYEGGGATKQGLAMLAALIVLGGAAAAAHLWTSPRGDRLLAAVGAVFVIGCGVTLAVSDHPPGQDLRGANAARFGSLETSRNEYWNAALEGFARDPVRGLGSGGFRVEWLRDRQIDERARDAHSLYVETLSELGLVGAALLAAFLGGIAAAARRAFRRHGAAATGLVAAFVVWALHAGLDWDWEMPAVTLPALLLAAALVALGDEPGGTDAADQAAVAMRTRAVAA
jgi:hypothetical protein